MYAESGTALYEGGGFVEFLMFRAEDYGNAVYCGLVDVVDAYAESTAHVGGIGITVEAAQQTEAVYDKVSERFGTFEGILGRVGVYALEFAEKHRLFMSKASVKVG